MEVEKPVILTLKTDQATQAYFNGLRKLHFPEAINYIDAHLTLFHHLGNDAAFVVDNIKDYEMVDSFSLSVSGLRHLGNGVAFVVSGQPLLDLHAQLIQQFQALLTPQDRQKFQPHITIQNKVPAVTSKELLEALKTDFKPFEILATGISAWFYAGGPWEHIMDINFRMG